MIQLLRLSLLCCLFASFIAAVVAFPVCSESATDLEKRQGIVYSLQSYASTNSNDPFNAIVLGGVALRAVIKDGKFERIEGVVGWHLQTKGKLTNLNTEAKFSSLSQVDEVVKGLEAMKPTSEQMFWDSAMRYLKAEGIISKMPSLLRSARKIR
ncbi:hypothetical protein GYMLUDRAFT_74884 [Collybiopsis luxurians FD-317 M1]|uniref:Uncharacterized protein n=1 Tax=Collybiopsis luxurians FD-317 M1 TaxID=944289 RepID=A0A0D0B5K4_9AGAR|nr:hypothetical protein GYMLUDRAFT_74884 [Collybiopsis luxurians FD-317 M1]